MENCIYVLHTFFIRTILIRILEAQEYPKNNTEARFHITNNLFCLFPKFRLNVELVILEFRMCTVKVDTDFVKEVRRYSEVPGIVSRLKI